MNEMLFIAGIALGVLAMWATYAHVASKTAVIDMITAECAEISTTNRALVKFAKTRRKMAEEE